MDLLNTMLRIAIDCRTIGKKRTGDEVYTKNLVLNLAKIDSRNQYFLLFDRKVEDVILGISLPSNFKIATITPSHKILWTMYSLPKWLIRNHVNILHVQYITPIWLPKHIKAITTIHDVSWKFYPQYIKKNDLLFLNTLIPLSLKRADKIITVSQTSKNDIVKIYKLPSEKVVMIYNGINTSVGYAIPDSDYVMQKYNLPKDFILYIGTLQPRKNIPALLKAFSILNTKYKTPDTKLVIGGGRGHNYDERIDVIVKKYMFENNVVFPGYIDDEDLPTLYKLAKVFVFPSLYEGFGIPPIEAMAYGTPVVVSDKSCLPETVGDAGLVVDPENSKAFAEAMYRAIHDESLRRALIEKGYKRAGEFSWERAARETLKLYENSN